MNEKFSKTPLYNLLNAMKVVDRSKFIAVTMTPKLGYSISTTWYTADGLFHWLCKLDPNPWADKNFEEHLTILHLATHCREYPVELIEKYKKLQ
ncbi:hypothetical protein A9Q83_09635 [Alphaproteobacteria bacterium 46_93_T64]|nr:hypothetical protein A9Q83_09635 [Alphaproteobacteria bacterium 46_93_T64]